jgi:hypothetical protein
VIKVALTYICRNHKIAYDLPSMKSRRAAGIGYGSRDIFKVKSKRYLD